MVYGTVVLEQLFNEHCVSLESSLLQSHYIENIKEMHVIQKN